MIARAVLGVPLADLDGDAVPLDALWGREADRIRERLAEVPSREGRFALTEALLTRRYEAAPPVDPEVARAWHRIAATRGLARIDALTAEVGWSRGRLWSRFRAQLGLPPKRAATLVRFDHAAHRLVAGEPASRVAADAGYADQSHLHREVAAYTGATPATVAREPFLAVDEMAWPGAGFRSSPAPRRPVRFTGAGVPEGHMPARRWTFAILQVTFEVTWAVPPAVCFDFWPAPRLFAVAAPSATRVPEPSTNSSWTRYVAESLPLLVTVTSASGIFVAESTSQESIFTSPVAEVIAPTGADGVGKAVGVLSSPPVKAGPSSFDEHAVRVARAVTASSAVVDMILVRMGNGPSLPS